MAVALPGNIRLPVLSNVQVYAPAVISTLLPEPIKLPTAKFPVSVAPLALTLPATSKLPITLAPEVVAIILLVPLGAKITLPLAPVITNIAPVSTILPVRFKLPAETLPV